MTLAVYRTGPAPPSVLFDAGAFGIYADGVPIIDALGAVGVSAISYTRRNLFASDSAPGPATPEAHADDMDMLLAASGQGGGVVLIGHSSATYRLRALADRHPHRVHGLVLVDAMVPELWPSPVIAAVARGLRPVPSLLSSVVRTMGRYPNAMGLTGAPRTDKLESIMSAAHLAAGRVELAALTMPAALLTPAVPTVYMPATPMSRGTAAVAERTGAEIVPLRGWGHARVLSAAPAALVAQAAARMLGRGL